MIRSLRPRLLDVALVLVGVLLVMPLRSVAAIQAPPLSPDLPASDSAYLAKPGTVSPNLAFLFSATVPGTGQLYAGTKRGVVYLLAEAGLLAGYVLTRRDAETIRDDYIEQVRAYVTFDGQGSFDQWNLEDFEHATLFDNWHNVYNDDNGQPIDRVGKFYWKDVAEFKDADPQVGEFIRESPQRQIALALRNRANDRFKDARRYVGFVLFNHLVSAIDARFAARSHNRTRPSVSVRISPATGKRDESVALLWNRSF